MQNVTKPTNEEILALINQFQTEGECEVFQDIDAEDDDGKLNIGIDEGFIEVFEKAWPGVSLDESMSEFFETLIGGFVKEIKDNPEYAEELKKEAQKQPEK